MEIVRPDPPPGLDRQMEQRHVVVDDVAIGEQPPSPRPHHMEVLRLVRVDAETPGHRDAQHEAEHYQRPEDAWLGKPGRYGHRTGLPSDCGRRSTATLARWL